VRKKLLIASVATAVVALAGAGALYGYDASRSDVIPRASRSPASMSVD
jgi:hypothetical protein